LETASNLLAELLVKMGKQLGYDFDKAYVKKALLSGRLRNIEQEQHALREGLLNLLFAKAQSCRSLYLLRTFNPSESSRLWNLNFRDRMDNHASRSSEIRFLREAHCNTHAGMSDERHRPLNHIASQWSLDLKIEVSNDAKHIRDVGQKVAQ
jgi:hypothetical protein